MLWWECQEVRIGIGSLIEILFFQPWANAALGACLSSFRGFKPHSPKSLELPVYLCYGKALPSCPGPAPAQMTLWLSQVLDSLCRICSARWALGVELNPRVLLGSLRGSCMKWQLEPQQGWACEHDERHVHVLESAGGCCPRGKQVDSWGSSQGSEVKVWLFVLEWWKAKLIVYK